MHFFDYFRVKSFFSFTKNIRWFSIVTVVDALALDDVSLNLSIFFRF